MPVLFTGREPDDVARPDLLDRATPTLRPAEPRGHDQNLAKRMGVPGRTRARRKSDNRRADPRRIGRIKGRLDAHITGEILRWAFSFRPLAASLDVHDRPHSPMAFVDDVPGRLVDGAHLPSSA